MTTTILIIIGLALIGLWLIGLVTRVLGKLIHLALIAAAVIIVIAIVKH